MSMREKRTRALALAAEGKTYRQIAEELGLPPVTVYSWIPTKEEESQFKEMAELRARGMTNTEIAARMGVNPKRVSAVLGPIPRWSRRQSDRKLIRMEPGTYDALRELSGRLGLQVGRGPEPRAGAIGRMLDAIARGELQVTWVDGYGPDAVKEDE